jgi:hypothetical protein
MKPEIDAAVHGKEGTQEGVRKGFIPRRQNWSLNIADHWLLGHDSRQEQASFSSPPLCPGG